MRRALLLLWLWAPFCGAATTYDYTAETQAAAKAQGVVAVGKTSWKCQGARCTAAITTSRPSVSACTALAKEVGAIRSFGYAQKQLTAAELERCNAGLVAKVTSKAKTAASYDYTAETQATARNQGAIAVGNANWKCQGARCTTNVTTSRPAVAACKALAQQVGPIKSYGHTQKQLTSGELERCNAGLVLASKPKPAADTVKPPPAGDAKPAAKGAIRTLP